MTILYLLKCKFPLLSDYSPHESSQMSVLGIAALHPTTIPPPPLLVSWLQDDGDDHMHTPYVTFHTLWLRPPFSVGLSALPHSRGQEPIRKSSS